MFKQKKLSVLARFGLWIVTFILGVLLLASTLAAVLIGNVMLIGDKLASDEKESPAAPMAMASAATENNGLAATRRLRSTQLPEQNEQEEESVPGNVADALTKRLFEMFYESVSRELEEEFPVTLDEFIELVERSTVKDYISEKTTALIVDYFNGEVTTTFEPEEIVELIKENEELIVEVTGEPIPDDIAQEIARVFDENEIVVKVEEEGLAGFIEMAGGEIPGISDILENNAVAGVLGVINQVIMFFGGQPINWLNINNIINAVRGFFSTQNMLICMGISVLLMLLILLVNCKQLGKGLRRISYPLMMVGLLSGVNIFAMATPDLRSFLPIVSQLREALVQTAWLNFVVFGLGVVLFVAGVVLGFLTGKMLKKAAASTVETAMPIAAPEEETIVE